MDWFLSRSIVAPETPAGANRGLPFSQGRAGRPARLWGVNSRPANKLPARRARGGTLAQCPRGRRVSSSAGSALTARNLVVALRASTHNLQEDTMRTGLAIVLAICGTFLITIPTVSAQQSPAPAQALAATPAINLNTATVDQLETLPGIGRKTAERIIEYRTKSGGFKRIEDLMNVKGIGEKSFLKLKPLVVVPPKGDKAPGE
jgi:competence protein ComEA